MPDAIMLFQITTFARNKFTGEVLTIMYTDKSGAVCREHTNTFILNGLVRSLHTAPDIHKLVGQFMQVKNAVKNNTCIFSVGRVLGPAYFAVC